MARKCDRLVVAGSVAEAVSVKSEQPEALFLSGGTTVFGEVGPAGESRVSLISIRNLAELKGARKVGAELYIGANTTAAELLRDPMVQQAAPLLVRAARSLASRQIRNRATVGGNISTSRADHTLVPALLVSEAAVHLTDSSGERNVPLCDYLQTMRTSQPDMGLVTGVLIEQINGFTGFTRVGPRNGPCYAIVSTALAVDPTRRRVRLAIGNAHRVTFRAATAEAVAEQGIDWVSMQADPQLFEAFGAEAARACDPVTDIAASADYRRHAVGVMSRRLLEQSLQAEPEGVRK